MNHSRWVTSSKHQLTPSVTGHTGPCGAVALNHDGTVCVSVSQDMTVRCFDTMSGKELNVLTGHTAGIYSVDVSQDGTRMATCSADKTIRVYDMSNYECTKVLTGHNSHVTAVRWLPGSNKDLVSSSWDDTIKVPDA